MPNKLKLDPEKCHDYDFQNILLHLPNAHRVHLKYLLPYYKIPHHTPPVYARRK